MARPCKNDLSQDGRQKLYDAFWSLLETHELRDLSVSMIVAKANCNRGTFYYHYHDLEGLINSVIEQDLVSGRRTIADALFGITTSNNEWALREDLTRQFSHLCLIMDKGGMKLVDKSVKRSVLNLWRAVLCPDGSELTPEAEIVIHFHASGILGVLSYLASSEAGFQTERICALPFFKETSKLLLEQLSEAQHVPMKEIAARLSTAARVVQLEA